MIQAVIIEDEKPAARRLQRMLQKENIQTNILLHSVQESVEWFNSNVAPDLIFADIHLSDGSAFEIFEKTNLQSPVIFTTAYDQYAIKAFKLNSIDYLLKPVRQEELHRALQKFLQQKLVLPDIKQLLSDLHTRVAYKERFLVQYGNRFQSLDVTDIALFYSQDKTTYLVNRTGEEFIYDKSLEYLEKQLNPKDFFRLNRQFIIRYSAIDKMLGYSNSRIKVILKKPYRKEIIVARERVKKFKNWLQ